MHRYFGVDLDILWPVVREDRPVLIDRVGRWFAGGLAERVGWLAEGQDYALCDAEDGAGDLAEMWR